MLKYTQKGGVYMTFEGAHIKVQGVEFAIVIVKSYILNIPSTRESTRDSFKDIFGDIPIILMCQDFKGIPTFHGRPDIVKYLANVDYRKIPWERYTIN